MAKDDFIAEYEAHPTSPEAFEKAACFSDGRHFASLVGMKPRKRTG